MENINISLSEMGDGILQEHFADAMAKVVKNILDLNTDPTKKRKITIEIDVLSDEYREDVYMNFTVKPPKLVGRDSSATRALIGREDGNIIANELKSGQRGQMFFDAEDSQLKDDKGTPVEEIEKVNEIENKVLKFK